MRNRKNLKRITGYLLAAIVVFDLVSLSGMSVSASENQEPVNEYHVEDMEDEIQPDGAQVQSDEPQPQSDEVPVSAAEAVTYLDCDGSGQNWEIKTCTDYTEITAENPGSEWSDGWYVVTGDMTISERVSVSGIVHLILKDGCSLKAAAGISVNEGQSLTIYAQSADDNRGRLVASAATEGYAGIGGYQTSGGTITINGGVVEAAGGEHASGIGGGYAGTGGTIIINAGTVKASGGNYAAGIGGGANRDGGIITINGGAVTANSGDHAAGIGGGNAGGAGTVTINNGTVISTGTYSGAGIGGGFYGSGGTVTITGGTITARSVFGSSGEAIGNGAAVLLAGGTINGTVYHTVTFAGDGLVGEDVPPVQGVADGEAAEVPRCDINGYTVAGWYTDPACGEHDKYDFSTPVTGDITLYAKLEESTDYIVEMTIDGNTVLYTSFTKAWKDAQGKTAVLKILKDMSLIDNMRMTDSSTDLTIEAAEGVVVESTSDFFIVENGKLTLKSGTYISSGAGKSGIYMTDGTVEMTGGTIKMTGTKGDIKAIRINGNGTLLISGGTLDISEVSSTGISIALLVSRGNVTLTGGTIKGNSRLSLPAVYVSGVVPTDLLGENYAFYNNDGDKLVTDAAVDLPLYGSYTVKECSHNYTPKGRDEEQHYLLCTACGGEADRGAHSFGDDGVCTVCSAERTVRVEIDGVSADYVSIENVWDSLYTEKGTITFLKDVQLDAPLDIWRGMDVTINMADGVSLTNTAEDCFQVYGGTLTLAGGTVKEEKTGESSVVYVESGILHMTGGTYESAGNGVYAEQNAEVQLSGGTINASGNTLQYGNPGGEVRTMLKETQKEECYVLWNEDQGKYESNLGRDRLTGGSYTVRKVKLVAELMNAEGLVYNGRPHAAKARVTLVDGTEREELREMADYTAQILTKEGDAVDNYERSCSAGEFYFHIMGEIYNGETNLDYTVEKAELKVTNAIAADRLYDGTNAVEITDIALEGVMQIDDGRGGTVSDDVAVDMENVQGTLSSANAGTYTSVTLPELTLTGDAKDNYTLAEPQGAVETSVTISPLDGVITVGTDTYDKTFGDAEFTLDVTDNNPEADVQYEVIKGAEVVSVSEGTVTIKNAGTAVITVSLPASENYTAAESRMITVNVAKKGGYTVDEVHRKYLYTTESSDSINLAGLLPDDCGSISYGIPEISGNAAYLSEPSVNEGSLSYTLAAGNIGDEGTISVSLATQNYEDFTITVHVRLSDHIPVSLKPDMEVRLKNDTLTYGEPLSELVFDDAKFIGSDGEIVEGILTWKDGEAAPDAGTTSASWIFTPADPLYIPLEGTAAITVNKAVPYIVTVPEASGIAEGETLHASVLSGGSAQHRKGTEQSRSADNSSKAIEGTFAWKDPSIKPAASDSNKTEYTVVFTPADTKNYETAECKVKLNVKGTGSTQAGTSGKAAPRTADDSQVLLYMLLCMIACAAGAGTFKVRRKI